MNFRLPVRRFIQSTDQTETPPNRFGVVQWVLSRPMCRFTSFNLSQVPPKNRQQALKLELAQWTPFASSEYYIGWHGSIALVWGWDTSKVIPAIVAQGLKHQRVQIMPETVLQQPPHAGLCLTQCHEGYEGQLWQQAHLKHSRWWPQTPTPQEWLMFQRDASIAPDQQQAQPPAARAKWLKDRTWLTQYAQSAGQTPPLAGPIVALAALTLLVCTCWYSFNVYKIQLSSDQLQQQQTALKPDAQAVSQARGHALDHLARISALRALAPYPGQLALMATVAQALPNDKSYLKDWEFQYGQLKLTVSAATDLSATQLISAFQQAGVFGDVKALPGRDAKSVTFQMEVIGNTP